MNFDLDENQSLFKATVERFTASADVPARHKTRALPCGFNRERWYEMAELGLIGIAGDEADGGLGGSLLDCAIVAQALGHAQAVEPWLECGFLGVRLLSGTPYAAEIINGKTLAAFAFAEPGQRFSLEAVSMQREWRWLHPLGREAFCAERSHRRCFHCYRAAWERNYALCHSARGQGG
jgi:alkylation response protein AidB-like acyl-CoA dehydrogenase